jgi:hypothetical protein
MGNPLHRAQKALRIQQFKDPRFALSANGLLAALLECQGSTRQRIPRSVINKVREMVVTTTVMVKASVGHVQGCGRPSLHAQAFIVKRS